MKIKVIKHVYIKELLEKVFDAKEFNEFFYVLLDDNRRRKYIVYKNHCEIIQENTSKKKIPKVKMNLKQIGERLGFEIELIN